MAGKATTAHGTAPGHSWLQRLESGCTQWRPPPVSPADSARDPITALAPQITSSGRRGCLIGFRGARGTRVCTGMTHCGTRGPWTVDWDCWGWDVKANRDKARREKWQAAVQSVFCWQALTQGPKRKWPFCVEGPLPAHWTVAPGSLGKTPLRGTYPEVPPLTLTQGRQCGIMRCCQLRASTGTENVAGVNPRSNWPF